MAFHQPSKRRRTEIRNSLWPECSALVWPQPQGEPFSDGWAKMPKYLPAIFTILSSDQSLNRGMDLAPVYIELLSRVFDEGLVELTNEDEHAHLSGLSSVKTWKKRLRQLEELELVKLFERVPGKLGYVVLVHPLHAVVKLHRDGKVQDRVWQVLVRRLIELNIDLEEAIQHFANPSARSSPKRGLMARMRERSRVKGPASAPATSESSS